MFELQQLVSFTLALCLLACIAVAQNIEETIRRLEKALTPQEKAFLETYPIIRIGNELDWPPFDYNVNGTPQGLAISYMKFIDTILTDTSFEYIHGYRWGKLQNMCRERKIDVLPVLWDIEERRQYMNFTAGYISNPLVLVMKKNAQVLESLDHIKTIALQKGVATISAIAKLYPQIKIVTTPTILEALLLVQSDRVDACMDSIGIVSYSIKKHFLNGLQINSKLVDKRLQNFDQLCIGIRSDWPLIRNVFQKALNAMTEEQRHSINKKWLELGSDRSSKDFRLTPKEEKWLQDHQQLHLGITSDWAPIEFINEVGVFQGVSSEYVQKINQAFDIKMNPQKGLIWEQVLAKAKNKEIDVLSCVVKMPSRSHYLRFTKPYLSLRLIIISEQDAPFINGLQGLIGKKIAAVKGYAIVEILKRDWPTLNCHLYDNFENALQSVSKGEVDAFIGNLATITYTIRTKGIMNIRVAATTKYSYDMAFGVRKDWPELVKILNRYLASFSQEEKKDIEHRWSNIHIEKKVHWKKFWYRITIIFFIVAIVFVLILLWNYRLGQEIKERRIAQQNLIASNCELQKAKKAEQQANQAKSKFLANMSHEIRTPMNAILGFTEILSEEEHDPQKKSYINAIHTSGKALLALINDVLDISKIEAGKIELQFSAVRLQILLEEMEVIFRQQTSDKELDFQIDIDNNFPIIISDEVRLRQILINLIGNAIKFTHVGHIKVKAKVHEVPKEERFRLVIEIIDSGIGIAKEQHKRIFEVFSQSKQQNYAVYGGTGLGLAIVKSLVELMEGKIEVESEFGKGTTFRITFDDVEIASTENIKTQVDNSLDLSCINFSSATILIVDDVKYNREIFAIYLKNWNFDIVFAHNGKEGIEKVKIHRPDLILLDMKMPIMNGYQASDILKRDPELRHIPIIAATASSLKQDEKIIAQLCDGYLRKPLSKRDLVSEIMKHISYSVEKNFDLDEISTSCQPVTVNDLAEIPTHQIQQIIHAAEEANVELLLQISLQLQDKKPIVANHIRKLVENFDYDSIVVLFRDTLK
ncbi:transporter substrate-binding domain-containing protein [Candidatus Uabimicrobium sp. HlEnr_7]|uniref:transporter substrate-binding domain-containing protein n=1 Tax=Candidatus Uabimicrobium helgolandensis TaxID=3095367 RepID=UPI0035581BE2